MFWRNASSRHTKNKSMYTSLKKIAKIVLHSSFRIVQILCMPEIMIICVKRWNYNFLHPKLFLWMNNRAKLFGVLKQSISWCSYCTLCQNSGWEQVDPSKLGITLGLIILIFMTLYGKTWSPILLHNRVSKYTPHNSIIWIISLLM